jgi:predicted DNA-binding transcriptional regulator AlpA
LSNFHLFERSRFAFCDFYNEIYLIRTATKPVSNIHHENSEPEINSYQRQQPRRLLRRTEAAIYIGVSASKFDELVKHGRMPHPKRIDACVRWDIRQLDPAIDKLPGGDDDDQNEWDEALP